MEKQRQIAMYSFVVLGIVLVGFFLYHKNDPLPVSSTFVLTPSPVLSPTQAPEPVVTSWTTYKNDTYNFTIDVPDGWNQQEITPPSGGLIVAFSPNALPCKTCTYVHEGYYSVRIFNNTTDQQAYADFTSKMQAIGKSKEILPIKLNNVTGFLLGNIAAVQNHGWVYEVVLDTNNGNDKALDSQLFQKAASSLAFTYLIFSN